MRAFSLQVKRPVNVRVNGLQKLCIAIRFLGFRLRGWFVAEAVAGTPAKVALSRGTGSVIRHTAAVRNRPRSHRHGGNALLALRSLDEPNARSGRAVGSGRPR